VLIRDFAAADLDAALALNNASVPDLNELDLDAMRRLLELADSALVAEVGGEFAGFCWVLTPGQPYDSLNYQWFARQYERFVYLDRITVLPHFRRDGVGRALYAELIRRYRDRQPVLTCEVNLQPRNDGSLRFHAGLGFVEVGQQHTDGGNKTVSLLPWNCDGRYSAGRSGASAGHAVAASNDPAEDGRAGWMTGLSMVHNGESAGGNRLWR
jgi:hypothetical protein